MLSSLPHSAFYTFYIHSICLYSLFSTLYTLTSALCTLNPLYCVLRSKRFPLLRTKLCFSDILHPFFYHSDCNTFHSDCYTLNPLRMHFSRNSPYCYTLHCAALTIALCSLLLSPLNSHSALCISIYFAVFSPLYSVHSEHITRLFTSSLLHFYLEHSAFSSLNMLLLFTLNLSKLCTLDSSPLRSLHLNTLYHDTLCTLLLYSGLFTNTSTQDTTLNLNLSDAPQLSYTLHLSRLCKTKTLCTSAITKCLYTPRSLKFTQHQVPQ